MVPPNERCIIANFLERYLHLIEDNKVHGGYSVWVDRAIRTVFYECLAVSRCGLHCGDMLNLEHDSNSLGHNLSTRAVKDIHQWQSPLPASDRPKSKWSFDCVRKHKKKMFEMFFLFPQKGTILFLICVNVKFNYYDIVLYHNEDFVLLSSLLIFLG